MCALFFSGFKKKFENFSEEWGSSLANLQNQIELLKKESFKSRLTSQLDDGFENGEILQQIYTDPDDDEELLGFQTSDDSAEHGEMMSWLTNETAITDGMKMPKNDTDNSGEFLILDTEGYEELTTSSNEVAPVIDDRRRIDGGTL